MAKFNEKVLCLFNKDYKQLKKEAERRGMSMMAGEKTIAKVIWKDAYEQASPRARTLLLL